jgi:hypothetical protein
MSASSPISVKRDYLFLGCQVGHDWETLGSRNCGCEYGGCSIPVMFCRRCGSCDYGDNAEAEQTRRECKAGEGT